VKLMQKAPEFRGKAQKCGPWCYFAKGNVRGITLTELLVVLAILGIMALLIMPRMIGFSNELYLRQTANQLVRDIRFVQQQAMNNPSGGWKITFVTSQVMSGQQADLQGWSTYRFEQGMSQMQNTRRLPPGLSYLGMNFLSREIRFSELGAPLSAGHIGIRNSLGHELYVIIAPVTGKARIDTKPPQ
jgi:prepilin-type N-terminal cleavage/methylation domain-containing protein